MTWTTRARLRVSGLTALAFAMATIAAGCASTAPAASPAPTPAATSAVVVDEIAQGDQNEPVDVEIPGPVQVNFREITLHPGGGTGKHCHYGNLLAVVKEGVFTHYAPTHPGGMQVYTAGQSVTEGAGYIHEGKNEGVVDVVLWVTYVTPEGKPLAEADLSKCAG